MGKTELDATKKLALVAAAKDARENAYARYSGFKVGAALLTRSGETFTGSNVENASYGATICAERVAVFKAVSEGHKEFDAIAVVADTAAPIPPCGMCRQVMAEFGSDLVVVMANCAGDTKQMTVGDLMPESFTLPEET